MAALLVLFFFCVLQHLTEQLELDLSPLEYMMKCYPEIKEKEEMRKIIGRYGLTGKQQVGFMFVPLGCGVVPPLSCVRF